jgi:phosphohistidine phosphatase SixA
MILRHAKAAITTTQARDLMLKFKADGSAAIKRLGRVVRRKFDIQTRRKRSSQRK